MEQDKTVNVKEQQEQLAMAMLKSFEDFFSCVFGIDNCNTEIE